MFDRIVVCLSASVLFWFGLMYFTSEAVPEGRAQTVLVFYLDIFVASAVFIILFTIFALPLMYIRWLKPDSTESRAVVLSKSASVWQLTTVSHLESLKSELQTIDQRLSNLRACERQVCERAAYAGKFKRWLGGRGVAILRRERRNDPGRSGQLYYAIERIYRGDVDPEIADYREEIIQIQLEREPVDKDSFFAEFVIGRNKNRDARIRRCERNIAELEQWRAKISAANALVTATQSPHEAAWRNFVDIANRTAAAPIIEARSRVEAAMTAIEAKRHYERLVSEQWRRGLLTDDEADYIQQRIREEFLGVKHSIYE